MSKISDEMLTLVEVADESESIQNKKREKIAELSKQIELHQKQLNMTDEQLLSEAYKEIEALKKKREELATKSQRQVEDGAAGTVFLQEQIAELTRENEELRVKNASLPTEEDLKREKEVIQAKLKEAVKDLRAGAIEMLQQNIDEENEYSGEIVKTAVNTILRRVSNKILGIEEPEEEPKQEEEEEEAEDPPAPEAEQEAENQNEEQEDENEGEQDGENEEDDHEEGGEGEEENGENEEENGEEDEGEAEEEGEE
ncbi:hypothetical protein TRFO_05100 [Tritrichomonas foetus]|uniref:Uncharacterized protein n=1 Tax=Tritrichomonas foetus TaxID=1144522 RepID=A0A1J4KAN9_9EUKA|nr:hypothetical protein TRFO_05100 [Tritrichomonas foetus]|eukprot:OHT07960.1 hypothetical protein TRFO_05100 [Tritrichomonas foetus]